MQIFLKNYILVVSLFAFAASVNALPVESSTHEPEISTTATEATDAASSSEFFCENDRDCSFNGNCDTETGLCHCSSGYIEADCSYKQKSQLAAFLLHFFLGLEFGAGNFYAGDNGKGGGEIALFWGSAFLIECGLVVEATPVVAVGTLGLLSSFGWWIAEAVRFGENYNKDGHGKPLESW